MEPSDEAIFELWQNAVRMALMLAKAARTAELRGDRRLKAFDSRGVHVYSAEWGRIFACEELIPELSELRGCGEGILDPVSLRSLAAREAESDFLEDVREGTVDWHRG